MIIPKVSSLFNKTDTYWIEIDFSRWGNAEPDKELFEIFIQAILKKQAIVFIYSSSYGETTSRTVYPLKLIFKSKAWYLQTYCLLKNDYRIFKITRMLSVSVSTSSFVEQEFTPPSIEPENSTSPALIHLKLCFDSHSAYGVYDEFDPKDVVKNED